MLFKKRGFQKCQNFHRKAPVWESLFNKVNDLRPVTLSKKRLQHRCFPVRFPKFLRVLISKNICERVLLARFVCIFKNKFLISDATKIVQRCIYHSDNYQNPRFFLLTKCGMVKLQALKTKYFTGKNLFLIIVRFKSSLFRKRTLRNSFFFHYFC